MATDLSLLRLLQLSSATLPVGGFSFSQGLEFAVEARWLGSAEEVEQWLTAVSANALQTTDLPILARVHHACGQTNDSKIGYWNDYVLACRETAELYANDAAMGNALRRLMQTLEMNAAVLPETDCSYVTAYACAAAQWKINVTDAGYAFAWSWLENQCAAATKLVPLGQSAAQGVLFRMSQQVPKVVAEALAVEDEDIGSSLPALAQASSWHETQYCRLFQS